MFGQSPSRRWWLQRQKNSSSLATSNHKMLLELTEKRSSAAFGITILLPLPRMSVGNGWWGPAGDAAGSPRHRPRRGARGPLAAAGPRSRRRARSEPRRNRPGLFDSKITTRRRGGHFSSNQPNYPFFHPMSATSLKLPEILLVKFCKVHLDFRQAPKMVRKARHFLRRKTRFVRYWYVIEFHKNPNNNNY